MNDNEKELFYKALHSADLQAALPDGFNALVKERIAAECRRREERDSILLTLALAGSAAGMAALLAAVGILGWVDFGALWSSIRNALSFDNLGLGTIFRSFDMHPNFTIVMSALTLLFYGFIILYIDTNRRRKAQ